MASSGAAAGGLFGAAPAGSSGAAAGGIFGAASSGSAGGGGIFGAAPAASGAGSGGGLFGAAPAGASGAASGGGLFGAAPAASGGAVFGAASSGGSAGAGLFGASAGASFGASGAASGGAAAAAAGINVARKTVLEHRKVTDVLRLWEERIHRQAQHFDAFATQVLQFDTEILQNVAKIKALTGEHQHLKQKVDNLDQSIQQVWDQQESLSCLLAGLEESLRLRAPPEVEPARVHARSEVLQTQLDELDRQAEGLAKDTESLQSALYAEPLTTVVRVLDAHGGALDTLQQQTGTMQQRLQVIESTF